MIFSWPAIRSFLLVAALSAFLTFWLDYYLPFDLLILWLLSINLITFLWFAKDKLCSMRENWPRTPEGAFMWMGLAGAFPALLIGMFTCHHKQAKPGFWVPMAFYMLIQIAFIYYFFGELSLWTTPATQTVVVAAPVTTTLPAQ